MPNDKNDDLVLPSDVVQGVAIGNLKAIADQPAMISNLAYADLVANTNLAQQNSVSNQQALNEVGLAVTGKAVTNVANLGPLEARSSVDVLTNNELAQTIADLKATVAAFGGGGSGPRPRPNRPVPDIIVPVFDENTSELVLIFEDPAINSINDLNIVNDVLNANLIVSIAPKV